MKRPFVVTIAILALIRPTPVSATATMCSIAALRSNPQGYFWPADSIAGFVAQATVIVRVSAVDSSLWSPVDHFAYHGNAGVLFRVLESLRGKVPSDTLTLPGNLVGVDDFNPAPVPYKIIRRAGQHGDCWAREYRRGGEYLMLLRPTSGGLSPHWAPLAPLNEQIHGANDPWVAWVRARIR